MLLTCSALRRELYLVLMLVVALYPWPSAGHQAAAQGPSLPPHCPGAMCVWLPLIRQTGPVAFQSVPYIRINLNRTIIIGASLVTTAEVPVYRVRYDALLFNAAESLVQTVPITPMLEMTEPGSINPIDVSITVCCDITRVELRLVSWQMSSDPPLVSLPVEMLRWTLGSGFAVAIRNNRDVPVHDVLVLVRHTNGTYTKRFPLIAPGEVVIYDNPEGDDFLGFYFRTWAQGYLAQ